MTEPLHLQALQPVEPLPLPNEIPNPNLNPNANPSSSSHSPALPPFEAIARAWLSSLPPNLTPSTSELDAWIDSNHAALSRDLRSLPRPQLRQWILSLHSSSSSLVPIRVQVSNEGEFPYRFQRTDLWKPVYRWLEAMDRDMLVNAKEISDWLSANPEVMERLLSKHSRYHLMHYIQRMHLKMLKKKGKLPKGLQLSAARASVKVFSGGLTTREASVPRKFSGSIQKENNSVLLKNKDAFLRYELLTDLQHQLTNALLKQKHPVNLKGSYPSYLVTQRTENNTSDRSSDMGKTESCTQIIPIDTFMVSIPVTEQSKPVVLLEPKIGQKRKRNPVIVTPAWSYSEASSGTSKSEQNSNLHCEEAGKLNIWKGNTNSSSSVIASSGKNIAMSLQGREKGISWPLACFRGAYAGRNRERWIPFLQGWRSLENPFEGPAVQLSRSRYSSWTPTWCSYTSSVAIAQPNIRQGVQKVLDVRFHPEGLPQLVCSSNEAPNELLLYNLLSGRAVQLNGHNCQIQAVEFAARGASIVSCGSNLLKVWDCTTGSCLFTLGSAVSERGSVGHKQKINAMTVNSWQSCLVVTSGAKGDGKLLLWNALRGELAADLNSNLRAREQVHPSIEAMEFCSENILACGSDCEYGGPAVVQLWDIESPESCISFPANDSYISSLKLNPDHNIIITGAGDGTIGLFDIRTCGTITHLSVGSGYEVTAVSFSSCGTYFTASSTSNNTLVWDTRVLPMNRGQVHLETSSESNDLRFFRPLHCLSHGKQMPTAEYAGQLPGHVDEGDQGVNDSRWLQREPVLVTVSGDGSIAMWDVTLAQPCIRHIVSHTRCANTVAVAPNDEYLCTGGDDQKVVLYHNKSRSTRLKWRLSHPMAEDD